MVDIWEWEGADRVEIKDIDSVYYWRDEYERN